MSDAEIIISVNSAGNYYLDGRKVFVVDSETSKDQNGDSWWTNSEHEDDLEEARSVAYDEGFRDAENEHDAIEDEADRHLMDLVDLVGVDAIREAARKELRSTPIKSLLSAKGVL